MDISNHDTPDMTLPHWVVSATETTGWVLYAGALAVLTSFCGAMVYGLLGA